MQLLQIDDILNVAVTCTKFFSGVRQCSLWIFLLKRDFSLTIDYEGVEQLILKYREEKIKRKSISRHRVVGFDEMFEDADIPTCNRTRFDLDPEIYDLPTLKEY
ncbi:hypothetical protein LSTR_LSTR011926 [Laodelphax striatellus]|uniref:F-box domain-containing protein n=1 Tax=Laodelphax striatellus TaxID=195883 RepID=A0A482WYV3_LAOST|nr:hypothetical protein LSTR_LSTR011926 [Laodelphax striatellus]